MNIKAFLPQDEQAEPIGHKNQRGLVGALYGLLGGSAFCLTAAVIDVFLYPDVPLGVEWPFFWARWQWIALGLAIAGFLSVWWHEGWRGVLSGTLAVTLLLMAASVFLSESGTAQLTALLIIFLPAMAVCLPLVLLLRWFVRRHSEFLNLRFAFGRIAILLALIVLLGAFGGSFLRMSEPGARAVEIVHTNLQRTSDVHPVIAKAANWPAHRGVPYLLYQSPSKDSTVGVDVRAVYDDGYTLVCQVNLYPGSPPFLSKCTENP